MIAKVLHCCLSVSILTSHQESSLHVPYTGTEKDVRSLSGQTRKYQKRNEKGEIREEENLTWHTIKLNAFIVDGKSYFTRNSRP